MPQVIRSLPHVKSISDSTGTVLLDLKRGKYFSLNSVGTEIWRKAERGASISEVLDHLGQVFEGAPEDVLSFDLTRFIERLRQEKLVDVGR